MLEVVQALTDAVKLLTAILELKGRGPTRQTKE
jgi:hypothetical protein